MNKIYVLSYLESTLEDVVEQVIEVFQGKINAQTEYKNRLHEIKLSLSERYDVDINIFETLETIHDVDDLDDYFSFLSEDGTNEIRLELQELYFSDKILEKGIS